MSGPADRCLWHPASARACRCRPGMIRSAGWVRIVHAKVMLAQPVVIPYRLPAHGALAAARQGVLAHVLVVGDQQQRYGSGLGQVAHQVLREVSSPVVVPTDAADHPKHKDAPEAPRPGRERRQRREVLRVASVGARVRPPDYRGAAVVPRMADSAQHRL